jgi:hypothetical protein
MIALSIWQPYASLVMAGAKEFETREWGTRIRGEVAIHAAASPAGFRLARGSGLWDAVSEVLRISRPEELPRGQVLGRVTLRACWRAEDLSAAGRIDPLEELFGDFTPGRFAFELTDPVPLFDPFPWRGGQRWFRVPLLTTAEMLQPELSLFSN